MSEELPKKLNLSPSNSYLNAGLKVTLGHHICELCACDHRVTSIISDVMVKPKGSTADEQEIDPLFWTYPPVSQDLWAWSRYCSDKCFGDVSKLDEICAVQGRVVNSGALCF